MRPYQNLINGRQLAQVTALASMTEQAMDEGHYEEATDLWSKMEDVIDNVCAVVHSSVVLYSYLLPPLR